MTDIQKERRTVRFQMMLEPSTAKAIDEWRWRNRVGSQAHAIRTLIQNALAAASTDGGNSSDGAESLATQSPVAGSNTAAFPGGASITNG